MKPPSHRTRRLRRNTPPGDLRRTLALLDSVEARQEALSQAVRQVALEQAKLLEEISRWVDSFVAAVEARRRAGEDPAAWREQAAAASLRARELLASASAVSASWQLVVTIDAVLAEDDGAGTPTGNE